MADRESLVRFLDSRASLITQKTIVGYCHVKTSLPLAELVRERPFADAFARAQWEGYAAVLADLVVVLEGRLRPAMADGAAASALAERLAELFAGVLAIHPLPAHRPEGWTAEIAAFRTRMAEVAAAPPRPIAEVSRVSARKLFQHLPIHERLRAPDAPAMEAGVRFLFVGLAREFDRDLDHPALGRALLGPAPPAATPP